MAPSLPPSPPADLFAPADWLALLEVSLTGIHLVRPVYGEEDQGIVDFAIEYLNPAGQRMTGLSAQPGGTLLGHFPDAAATGIFTYYRRVFEEGEHSSYEVNYQADGLDNYFQLAAKRSGERLVVSFTDTSDHDRSAVEQALRESQARERHARADAERERQRFYDVLQQLPAQVATYYGPDHVFNFVNARFRTFVASEGLLGQPVREAAQGAVPAEVFTLLDGVYATGEPVHLPELKVMLAPHDPTRTDPLFVNAFYLPLRDGEGRIYGVLDFSYDVTEQVLARRQVQQLNQELENRVAERTAELQAALLTTEQQREQLQSQQLRLQQILGQAPAMIATLESPDHRYAFTNPGYDALVSHRARLGAPVAECVPELVDQGFIGLLDGVYRTGQAHVGREIPIAIQSAEGPSAAYYLDITYQPLTDAQGQTTGILAFIVDVTDKVLARRQTEALQAELLTAAERQAQERESFYRVFEQAPACIALLRSPGHRFEYVNPAYQAFFPGRQLVGRDAKGVAPELVAQGFVALLDQVYQTGETYFGAEVPFTPLPAPGQPARTQYFNFTYQAYREAGEVAGVSIFALDVTEQVEARRAQEAERKQLHTLFMEAPAPIVILDGPDLVYQLVNPAYQRIFPGRTLLGKALLEALPELAETTIPTILQQVYRTGETYVAQELPLQLARTEGGPLEEIYWTFTYQARRNARGEIDGVMVFAHEVTDQVQARRVVEASARQLRLITDALPVLIGYLDREEKYCFANQAYRAWFKQAPAALLGRPVREVVGEAAYANVQLYIQQALAGERVDFDAQMPYREGFTRHIRASYVPDVQGTAVVGFYTLVTDMTDQVASRQQVEGLNQELAAINEELTATNEELHESNTQLLRTNADLDTFVYAASHDLKAPITNIEGLLDALREYLPAGDQQPMVPRLVAMMQGAISRFQQTVGHLTDVVRLQYTAESVAEEVDVPRLLEDVRLDLLPLLESTQAQLYTAVEPCPPVRLPAKNMRSILFNLLSNALKYRAPDRAPMVQVRTHCTAAHFVLEVQDNGLGLSQEQQLKLFTMFRRLHTHVEGSGVGLYMIKRMIELAGGRIAVHSQPGVGSTFTVTLPHA